MFGDLRVMDLFNITDPLLTDKFVSKLSNTEDILVAIYMSFNGKLAISSPHEYFILS